MEKVKKTVNLYLFILLFCRPVHAQILLKLEIRSNKKKIELSDRDSLTLSFNFHNDTKADTFVMPDEFPQCGYKENRFIDNDFYLIIRYSSDGKCFSDYKFDNNHSRTSYSEVFMPEIKYRLLPKSSKTFDGFYINDYYPIGKKGIYKIKCIMGPKYFTLKSNEITVTVR